MRGAKNAVAEPALLGQKGFSRSDGFFEACGGIFQDGFDLAAPNAGEPLQKFVHRGSVFQVFKQSADGNSRSPKNIGPTDLLRALLNAFALEPEVHRNTIPREGSSSTKIPFLTDSAGVVREVRHKLLIFHCIEHAFEFIKHLMPEPAREPLLSSKPYSTPVSVVRLFRTTAAARCWPTQARSPQS